MLLASILEEIVEILFSETVYTPPERLVAKSFSFQETYVIGRSCLTIISRAHVFIHVHEASIIISAITFCSTEVLENDVACISGGTTSTPPHIAHSDCIIMRAPSLSTSVDIVLASLTAAS